MNEEIGLSATAALVAALVGLGFHLSGDREARSWALPAAVAVLAGGIGYAFYLPGWLTAGLFLLILFLLHRSVRGRLERAAKGLARVEVPEIGVVLQREADPGKEAVAVWTGVPRKDRSVVTAGSVPAAPEAGLALRLSFRGETEDAYSVVLESESARFVYGVMVCHHAAAPPRYEDKVLAEAEPLSDLPGLTPDIVVRAVPADYAFTLLDLRTLTSVAEIIALRGASREVYLTVSGPRMRVASDRVFSKGELERLLQAAAAVALRVRVVGILSESM